jgi:outer membrane protein OmpA-like peptidoglycan-associated protein
VNDYGKSEARRKPRQLGRVHRRRVNGSILIAQLCLLEAVDRRVTPEHVAKGFHDLLERLESANHLSAPADVDRQALSESGIQHGRLQPRRLPWALRRIHEHLAFLALAIKQLLIGAIRPGTTSCTENVIRSLGKAAGDRMLGKTQRILDSLASKADHLRAQQADLRIHARYRDGDLVLHPDGGVRTVAQTASDQDKQREQIEADINRGSFRHRRLPAALRRVPLLVFGADALLLLYFFSGVTNVNWASPLSAALIFAVLLAAMVTGISFAFFRFTGDRLQQYKDAAGVVPLRGLDAATTVSIGLELGAMIILAALIFIRMRAEMLNALGPHADSTAVIISLALALVSILANTLVIAVHALDGPTEGRLAEIVAMEGITAAGRELAAADRIIDAARAVNRSIGPTSEPAVNPNDEKGIIGYRHTDASPEVDERPIHLALDQIHTPADSTWRRSSGTPRPTEVPAPTATPCPPGTQPPSAAASSLPACPPGRPARSPAPTSAPSGEPEPSASSTGQLDEAACAQLLVDITAAIEAAPRPATLIVISSGLTTAGGFDLRQVDWDASPSAIANELERHGLLPDLAGCKVVFSGLSSTSGDQPAPPLPRQAILDSYWLAICQAAGATSCTTDESTRPEPPSRSTTPVPVVPVPNMTSARGPHNSVITTVPDTLLFALNSTTLLPGADSVLQLIAQQASAQDEQFTITGYASPDGGIFAYNRALSLRRAEAVHDRLIFLGLPSGQITRVTGGGTADHSRSACLVNGKFDEALCAQLRRVVITLIPTKG